MKPKYLVYWDIPHDCGTFSERFNTKREAAAFARAWKRDMVAADENRAEAREAYQWEIVEADT